MDNSLLLSLSNQLVARRTMEVIANNIANMNTTGYKRESPVFQEYVVEVGATGPAGPATEKLSFVRDALSVHDMSNGNLVTTSAKLDVAMEGPGFFRVATPAGERYTRNGHFGRDDTGRLVTSAGHPVLDEGGGEIVLAPEETEIKIATDGTISTEQGVRGRLGVVTFENPQTLKKEGDSLWSAEEPALPGDGVTVVQGMLEESNVQPVVEMVRMMETLRSYQASSEMLNMSEDLTRRAVQRLGDARV